MSIRRDFTNQFGAFTPTETAAIANVDRERRPNPPTPPRTRVMREEECARLSVQKRQPAPQKDGNLKRVRQLYCALCSIAGMMDCQIESLTLKCKGDTDFYQTMGVTRKIERCEQAEGEGKT